MFASSAEEGGGVGVLAAFLGLTPEQLANDVYNQKSDYLGDAMEAAEQVLLEAAREKGRGEELQEAIHAHIRKKHQQKLKDLDVQTDLFEMFAQEYALNIAPSVLEPLTEGGESSEPHDSVEDLPTVQIEGNATVQRCQEVRRELRELDEQLSCIKNSVMRRRKYLAHQKSVANLIENVKAQLEVIIEDSGLAELRQEPQLVKELIQLSKAAMQQYKTLKARVGDFPATHATSLESEDTTGDAERSISAILAESKRRIITPSSGEELAALSSLIRGREKESRTS